MRPETERERKFRLQMAYTSFGAAGFCAILAVSMALRWLGLI